MSISANIPDRVKTELNLAIAEAARTYQNENDRYFSRNRILDVETMLKLLISMQGGSLQKELYEAGISPYKVPDFVGVPLLNSYMYSVPAIVWQGLVYIDLLKSFKKHGVISKAWIRTRFLERIKNKDIILNQTPLIKQDIFTALVEYLKFLEKIDYLEKVSVNHYIIRDDITFDDTLEEVIKLRLYNFLKGI